jgi:predicted metal-dependent peptidase
MSNMPLELQAGRLRLVRDMPYFASLCWSLVPVEKQGMGTVGVDEWHRLYFDPAAIARWQAEELELLKGQPNAEALQGIVLASVLYHEIMHLLREHADRCRNISGIPELFNLAGDAEINDDIAEETRADGGKWTLPKGCIMPATYGKPNGLFAEEYYDHIQKSAKIVKVCSCGGQGQQGQDGTQPDGGSGKGKDKDKDGQGAGTKCPKCGGYKIPGGAMPGLGRCGSGATGAKEPWEDGAPGEQGAPPGVKKAEAEIIRRKVAEDIIEHSKTRGNMPAGLVRWAKDKLHAKIDWRRHLASAIRMSLSDTIGMVDYSYRRPSRRASAIKDIVLPSFRRPIPEVVVQIDTSGSMSDKMVAQACAETAGVLKSLGYMDTVKVFSVDAAMGPVKKIFKPEQIELVGGGGTDMGVGIAHVMKMKPRPHMLIVLTDCYTPWPAEAPPFRVIIGKMSDGQLPTWPCKVIEIKDDGKKDEE